MLTLPGGQPSPETQTPSGLALMTSPCSCSTLVPAGVKGLIHIPARMKAGNCLSSSLFLSLTSCRVLKWIHVPSGLLELTSFNWYFLNTYYLQDQITIWPSNDGETREQVSFLSLSRDFYTQVAP